MWRLVDSGVGAALPLVEAIEQAVQLEIGETAGVGQPAGEEGHAVADRPEATDDLDAELGERVEVERSALGSADQLRRRNVAGPDEIVDRVVALVEHAGGFHPPEDVAASIGARHPHVLADGQRDLSSAAVDLVGELHAGGRSPDDEHPGVVELVG